MKHRIRKSLEYRRRSKESARPVLNKAYRKEIWRKSIHLSSLWIPLFIYLARPGITVTVFALLLAGNLFIEYANFRHWKWARKSFGRLFCRTLRNREAGRIRFQVSGSMYVLTAAILCTLLFARPVAAIALTVMLVSDSCAALFGKAYGTRMLYKNKSLEGTAAFFVSALLVNMAAEPLWHFTYASVLACAAATFAEMFEDKIEIDDNLSIPLTVGIILTVFNL